MRRGARFDRCGYEDKSYLDVRGFWNQLGRQHSAHNRLYELSKLLPCVHSAVHHYFLDGDEFKAADIVFGFPIHARPAFLIHSLMT